jgi:hypothetical protein
MIPADRIYAFDFETDNSQGHGLNPLMAGITDIALATGTGETALNPSLGEQKLLDLFRDAVQALPAGIIGTWGGTHFDVPYLRTRMGITGCPEHGFTFTPTPEFAPKYQVLPGSDSGFTFTARSLVDGGLILHFDVAYACKPHAERLGVPWRLKPFAEAIGLDVIELDRTRLHEYTEEERRAYNVSDARATREIILWLLGYPAAAIPKTQLAAGPTE